MYNARFGGGGGFSNERDLSAVAEVLLKAIQDLQSINKELKYANWLKLIELKSKGLYDERQLKEDMQHFGLEAS